VTRAPVTWLTRDPATDAAYGVSVSGGPRTEESLSMPSTFRANRFWLAILAAFALVLAACNDDAPPDVPPEEDPADAAAEVRAEGNAFQPETLNVAAGTTVTFTNLDAVPHTATAGAPGSPEDDFRVDLPSAGDSGDVTFDTTGTFVYFCEIHPTMTGQIVVE
jgi:plastocyanin